MYGNKGTEEEYIGIKNQINMFNKFNEGINQTVTNDANNNGLNDQTESAANAILAADFKGTADTL